MSKTPYSLSFFAFLFFFFGNLPLLWTIKQQVAPTKKLISCSSEICFFFLHNLILKCHFEQANPSEWFFTSFYLKIYPRSAILFRRQLTEVHWSKQMKTLQLRKSPLSSFFSSPGQCPVWLQRDTILHNENGENMIRAITGTDRTADS